MQAFEVIFIGLPVYQSLLFAFFALYKFKTGGERDKLFLGFFMLVNSSYFLASGVYILRLAHYYPFAYYLGVPLFLLLIPSFYIYLKSILVQDFSINRRLFYHLLPPLTLLILNLPYLFLSTADKVYFIHYAYGRPDMPFVFQYLTIVNKLAVYGGIATQMFFYAFRFYKYYPKYQSFIQNLYSYRVGVDLRWIRVLAVLFVFFYILLDLYHFLILPQQFIYRFNINLLLMGLNFAIGFYGIFRASVVHGHQDVRDYGLTSALQPTMQPKQLQLETEIQSGSTTLELADASDLVVTETQSPESTEPGQDAKAKYRKSPLKPDQVSQLIGRLEIYISENEPYVNPLLTLDELSAALETNSKYLSQAINEHYGMNFYTLINELRINKAKAMLAAADHKTFSMSGIAQSSGFNSKSAFNAAFKKFSGQTPTQFLDEGKGE
jgi:AraC-like DNA-binding protein